MLVPDFSADTVPPNDTGASVEEIIEDPGVDRGEDTPDIVEDPGQPDETEDVAEDSASDPDFEPWTPPDLPPEVDTGCTTDDTRCNHRIIEICDSLADTGRTVLTSGLLKDFRDDYFPFSDTKKDMSDLVRVADYMIYLKAICTYEEQGEICGREATRVQRFIDGNVAPYDSPIVVVGGAVDYKPRCRSHFQPYTLKARRSRVLPLFPEHD